MPDIEKLEAIIYQIAVNRWKVLMFDVTDKHHRKFMVEDVVRTRYDAEQYAKDMEDFYLCDLEVKHGRTSDNIIDS